MRLETRKKLVSLKDWLKAQLIPLMSLCRMLQTKCLHLLQSLSPHKITAFLRNSPKRWPSLIEKLNLQTNSNLNCTNSCRVLINKHRSVKVKANQSHRRAANFKSQTPLSIIWLVSGVKKISLLKPPMPTITMTRRKTWSQFGGLSQQDKQRQFGQKMIQTSVRVNLKSMS